jgi:hypothetical protein
MVSQGALYLSAIISAITLGAGFTVAQDRTAALGYENSMKASFST